MTYVANEIRMCPACGSMKTARKAGRQNLAILRCDSCALEFADFENQPRSGEVIDTDPDFFHGLTDSFDKQLSKAYDVLPKRLEAYAQLLNRPVTSVLEVGCATGVYAKAFGSLGIRYRGIEIDEKMARQARVKTSRDIVHGNFMDADEGETFDLFFCSQVLEHVPAPQPFIEKAARIVGDGLVHVDVPNHSSLAASIRKMVDSKNYGFIQPPYHMIAYNKQSLSGLFERSKVQLDILRAFRNDHPVWGQLVSDQGVKNKLQFAAADLIGRGSLLTAIGRPSVRT